MRGCGQQCCRQKSSQTLQVYWAAGSGLCGTPGCFCSREIAGKVSIPDVEKWAILWRVRGVCWKASAIMPGLKYKGNFQAGEQPHLKRETAIKDHLSQRRGLLCFVPIWALLLSPEIKACWTVELVKVGFKISIQKDPFAAVVLVAVFCVYFSQSGKPNQWQRITTTNKQTKMMASWLTYIVDLQESQVAAAEFTKKVCKCNGK